MEVNMTYPNFNEALDEAIEFVSKNYSTSTWEGDIHDFYALLVKANFTNQVFLDYLRQAVKNQAYLPNKVTCIIDKGNITKITIGD